MSQNQTQTGNTITISSLPYNVTAGDGVQWGATTGRMFGVAAKTALSGASCSVDVVGVFTLPSGGSDAVTAAEGDKAYWMASAKLVTATSTANTLIGNFMAARGANATSVTVRLNGAPV